MDEREELQFQKEKGVRGQMDDQKHRIQQYNQEEGWLEEAGDAEEEERLAETPKMIDVIHFDNIDLINQFDLQ